MENIRKNKLNLLLSVISGIMCLYCFYPFINYYCLLDGAVFVSLIVLFFIGAVVISWLVITKFRQKWIGGVFVRKTEPKEKQVLT